MTKTIPITLIDNIRELITLPRGQTFVDLHVATGQNTEHHHDLYAGAQGTAYQFITLPNERRAIVSYVVEKDRITVLRRGIRFNMNEASRDPFISSDEEYDEFMHRFAVAGFDAVQEARR